MILGFNHNVMYKGEVFHVQTEDSGVSNPHIITLLYRGGVILSSKKTSYADILQMDNLEQVVEELMKAQHKEMMRRLKSGEFDVRVFSSPRPAAGAPVDPVPGPAPEKPGVTPKPVPSAAAVRQPDAGDFPAPAAPPASSGKPDISLLFSLPETQKPQPAQEPAARSSKEAVNLDEAILNFFGAGNDK